MEGRVRAALSDGSAGSADEFQIVHFPYVFTADIARVTLLYNVFLTFSWTSLLKYLLLRAFLAGNPPKKLSKLGVLDERSMKTSTNIAPECHPSHQVL